MRLVIVFTLATGLACELQYGIQRFADVAAMPQPGCVSKVLHSIAEIDAVEEIHSEPFHSYRYEGADFWAHVAFHAEADGTVFFINERISVNRKPSDDEVAATRVMMRAVELQIASDCGIPGLRANVSEECLRVDCEDS